MHIAKVVEALSLREFISLCSVIDEKAPKTVISFSHDLRTSVVYDVAGNVKQRKFNVIKVCREDSRIRVLVDLGRGKVVWFHVYPQK